MLNIPLSGGYASVPEFLSLRLTAWDRCTMFKISGAELNFTCDYELKYKGELSFGWKCVTPVQWTPVLHR